MFNKSFLSDIRKSLTIYRNFHEEDFIIEEQTPEDEEFVTLFISYRYDSEFFFKADVLNEGGFVVSAHYSPGIIMNTEDNDFKKVSDFKDSIASWTERVNKELMDRPLNRKIEEKLKEIDEITARFADLPNEYFTRIEADEMKEKLDALEKDLLQRLAQLNLENEEFETKQSSLHCEIEELKKTVELLKKPGWAGSLMVKVSSWVKSSGNEKLLKDGAAFIAKQLLEEGKKQLGA